MTFTYGMFMVISDHLRKIVITPLSPIHKPIWYMHTNGAKALAKLHQRFYESLFVKLSTFDIRERT